MDEYGVVKLLGEGSYGKVYLVLHKKKKKRYVMKVVNLTKMPDHEKEAARNEVNLMKALRHPNVVGFKESFVRMTRSKRPFQRPAQQLCIVMTFCDGGDLAQRLESRKKRATSGFSENVVMQFFVQMCLGLHYMHANKMLHRDIKPMNIFLLGNGRLVLGDLGVSKELQHREQLARTQIGTPYYMSPELFKNKPYDGAADIWALGCLLFELVSLKRPFDAQSMGALALKVISEPYAKLPNDVAHGIRGLIEEMLQKDPTKRPTVRDILRKPYVAKHVVKFLKDIFERSTSEIGEGTAVVRSAAKEAVTGDPGTSHRMDPNRHGRTLVAQLSALGLDRVLAKALRGTSGLQVGPTPHRDCARGSHETRSSRGSDPEPRVGRGADLRVHAIRCPEPAAERNDHRHRRGGDLARHHCRSSHSSAHRSSHRSSHRAQRKAGEASGALERAEERRQIAEEALAKLEAERRQYAAGEARSAYSGRGRWPQRGDAGGERPKDRRESPRIVVTSRDHASSCASPRASGGGMSPRTPRRVHSEPQYLPSSPRSSASSFRETPHTPKGARRVFCGGGADQPHSDAGMVEALPRIRHRSSPGPESPSKKVRSPAVAGLGVFADASGAAAAGGDRAIPSPRPARQPCAPSSSSPALSPFHPSAGHLAGNGIKRASSSRLIRLAAAAAASETPSPSGHSPASRPGGNPLRRLRPVASGARAVVRLQRPRRRSSFGDVEKLFFGAAAEAAKAVETEKCSAPQERRSGSGAMVDAGSDSTEHVRVGGFTPRAAAKAPGARFTPAPPSTGSPAPSPRVPPGPGAPAGRKHPRKRHVQQPRRRRSSFSEVEGSLLTSPTSGLGSAVSAVRREMQRARIGSAAAAEVSKADDVRPAAAAPRLASVGSSGSSAAVEMETCNPAVEPGASRRGEGQLRAHMVDRAAVAALAAAAATAAATEAVSGKSHPDLWQDALKESTVKPKELVASAGSGGGFSTSREEEEVAVVDDDIFDEVGTVDEADVVAAHLERERHLRNAVRRATLEVESLKKKVEHIQAAAKLAGPVIEEGEGSASGQEIDSDSDLDSDSNSESDSYSEFSDSG